MGFKKLHYDLQVINKHTTPLLVARGDQALRFRLFRTIRHLLSFARSSFIIPASSFVEAFSSTKPLPFLIKHGSRMATRLINAPPGL